MSTVFFVEASWNEDQRASTASDYEVNELENLCFTCPLKDCKDSSAKCPINIAKAAAKKNK